MFCLGLAGKRLSGKTCAANIIINENPAFRKLSFADSLKEMYAEFHNIPVEDLSNRLTKEAHRNGLVEMGTKLKKKDPLIFIKRLQEKLLPDDLVVIDDVRFIEEVEFIRKLPGQIWRIESEKAERFKRGMVPNRLLDADLSETELDLCAHTYHVLGGGLIYNNKTLEDFTLKIQTMLVEL